MSSNALPGSGRREETLPDGQTVVLREVDQHDRDELAAGFEKLSDESRYSRFFSPRRSLSEREIERLTTVDGYRHFAVGVELEDTPVAIAHFFRDQEEPNVAEIAITVLDDYQGRGIGQLLFRELIDVARHRGIDRFKADVLADNRHMRHLIKKLSPEAKSQTSRGVAEYQIPLTSTQDPENDRSGGRP